MSKEHTPGPWVIDESRHGKTGPVHTLMVVAERGGMPGLIINQGPVYPQDWANARLISAAPDLLEALEGVVRIADRDTVEFAAARAAITRATKGA